MLKQQSIPMIVHNGYKILADMTKFVYYLYENFKIQMTMTNIWPKNQVTHIVALLDWYSTKLRPFMQEFYGIMAAASRAGLITGSEAQHDEHLND